MYLVDLLQALYFTWDFLQIALYIIEICNVKFSSVNIVRILETNRCKDRVLDNDFEHSTFEIVFVEKFVPTHHKDLWKHEWNKDMLKCLEVTDYDDVSFLCCSIWFNEALGNKCINTFSMFPFVIIVFHYCYPILLFIIMHCHSYFKNEWTNFIWNWYARQQVQIMATRAVSTR